MLKSFSKILLVLLLAASTITVNMPDVQAKSTHKRLSPYSTTTTKVINTVVRIDVFKSMEQSYFDEKGKRVVEDSQTLHILGSGVFITKNGSILTCGHLFRNKYTFITITYIDEYGMFQTVPGTVDIVDFKKDLALIHTNTGKKTFPYVKLVKEVVVGEEILVIGHPCALDFTVSRGIISSLSRYLDGKEVIQIDASTNPGNSGGPVFDLEGNVVGIVSFLINPAEIAASAGLNFIVSFRECAYFLFKNSSRLK